MVYFWRTRPRPIYPEPSVLLKVVKSEIPPPVALSLCYEQHHGITELLYGTAKVLFSIAEALISIKEGVLLGH